MPREPGMSGKVLHPRSADLQPLLLEPQKGRDTYGNSDPKHIGSDYNLFLISMRETKTVALQ